MRLSKLEAAMRLGVSPSTIDRMIQRGQLEAEKDPHGTRYKVWVLLDDEQTENQVTHHPVNQLTSHLTNHR